MVSVLSWLAAQFIKTIIYLIVNREIKIERLVGAGGMPSSHSAMVCSLLVGSILKHGASSEIFAISFVLAVVVMYDAMGVRRETGKQAAILNRIIQDLKHKNQIDVEQQLKEMVGHTPFQVMAGAVLGIAIALLIPVF